MVSPYLGVFYRNNEIRPSYLDALRFPFIGYPYIGSIGNNVRNNPVWVANRNNPIPDIYGKLIIDANGKLISIISSGGTVLDLFNPTPLVTRNASVTLLDTGNLVLRELHPDGSVKRQSFDYPTDTLLPGMKLGINLKTGHRWSLTSWWNDELPVEVGDLNRTGPEARECPLGEWTLAEW
ncbi:putative non-specific serine/threonine protein kinase [Helianthus anomalus]